MLIGSRQLEAAYPILLSGIIVRMGTVVRPALARRRYDELIRSGVGKNGLEDSGTMIRKYPLMNDYWQSKRAKLDQIEIPMYILASYSSGLHTEGSIRGFLFSSSAEKW